MAAFLDKKVVALIRDLKARYKHGLPVMAPTEDERPLRTEEVANRDLDLGLYNHPVVLTLIASKDPASATALAALSRLVANAHQRKLVAALTILAGELSQHADVRTGSGIARQHDFTTAVADRLGEIALGRVDGERAKASEELVALLKRLHDGRNIPPDFLCDVLRLGYAADLRRDTLKSMLISIFSSEELRPRIMPIMAESLPFFPRELLIAVASEINHMTNDPDHSFLKREMQIALSDKERDRRPQTELRAEPKARPVTAEGRKPDVRPWMPMIQKASQLRGGRRAA